MEQTHWRPSRYFHGWAERPVDGGVTVEAPRGDEHACHIGTMFQRVSEQIGAQIVVELWRSDISGVEQSLLHGYISLSDIGRE